MGSAFGPDAIEIEPIRMHVNDEYVASFAITGYPREVRPGWLSPLFTHNGSIDVAMHVEPMPSQVAAEQLRRQLARLESSRRVDASRGHLADPTVEVAALDAQELSNRLARGESRLFRIGLTIVVRALDGAGLDADIARIRAILASLLVDIRPTTFRQLEGWKSTLPLGLNEVGITRTFDTQALAATYPFTPSGFAQPGGVLYGRNVSSSGLVFLDRFAQDNHNSVILARSGAGKSYLAKLELLRSLYRGIDVIVVDPEDEYRRLCEAVDGVYLHLGADGVKLNPFDLGEGTDAYIERALFIHSLVSALVGSDLDAATKAVLDRSIVAAYARAGITSDPRTYRRKPPTLANLDVALRSEGDVGSRLADQLAPYITGTHRHLFDGQTTAQSQSHLVVYSLRDVPEELKAAATMVVLNQVWRVVSNPSALRRRMVVVDEAWLVMRDRVGAKFLFRLAKSARKYWCGLTVVTQDAADLLGTELGRAIVSNAATQILLRQSPQAIDMLTEAFRLSEGERSFLLTAERGSGIIAASQQRVAFAAIASKTEHGLVTSSPAELTEMSA